MRRFTATLSVAILVAACSPVQESVQSSPTTDAGPSTTSSTTSSTLPATTTTPPEEVVVSGDLSIIQLPNPDGSFPGEMLVTACDIRIPYSALGDIAPLQEVDPGGIQTAIEPFLANEEGANWPQEDWLMLFFDDTEAVLVNFTRPGTFASMNVELVEGEWTWRGASLGEAGCPIKFATPEDLNRVEWRLDETKPAPNAQSTTLNLLLSERNCTGGIEIGDRLLGPQLVMSAEYVGIAFAAVPPEGEYFECPGNPELSYELDLPVPLGDRTIREDSTLGVSLEDFVPSSPSS